MTFHWAGQRVHLSMKQHVVWFRTSAECVNNTVVVALATTLQRAHLKRCDGWKQRRQKIPARDGLRAPVFAERVREPAEKTCGHGKGAGTPRVMHAGAERDKKSFVRVTEFWLNACQSDMSKRFGATESLWYKGVEKLCQPECLTGPTVVSLSSWEPHIWMPNFHLSKPKFSLKLLRAFKY